MLRHIYSEHVKTGDIVKKLSDISYPSSTARIGATREQNAFLGAQDPTNLAKYTPLTVKHKSQIVDQICPKHSRIMEDQLRNTLKRRLSDHHIDEYRLVKPLHGRRSNLAPKGSIDPQYHLASVASNAPTSTVMIPQKDDEVNPAVVAAVKRLDQKIRKFTQEFSNKLLSLEQRWKAVAPRVETSNATTTIHRRVTSAMKSKRFRNALHTLMFRRTMFPEDNTLTEQASEMVYGTPAQYIFEFSATTLATNASQWRGALKRFVSENLTDIVGLETGSSLALVCGTLVESKQYLHDEDKLYQSPVLGRAVYHVYCDSGLEYCFNEEEIIKIPALAFCISIVSEPCIAALAMLRFHRK
ncbi:hypothetical protein SeLEV6574_g01901 [Synchytrium endobioticum]|uniref:Uncharacterized protein n=1 Tax=Synchytrium endobioticum TaxID=286115 RepID=A0A507DAT3_9FUNG|nr:hypothetical protein SeLEV6574_g01901 [Synchytrium endobioticum]